MKQTILALIFALVFAIAGYTLIGVHKIISIGLFIAAIGLLIFALIPLFSSNNGTPPAL